MSVFGRFGLAAALSAAAFAQTASTPAFQLADVQVSPKTATPANRPAILRGDRYEIRGATMVDLIRTAYGVDADKVLGGPSWLEWDRFDVTAKTPRNTSPDALKLMLQNLLANRFKLVVHKDTKELPGFALTAGKKSQLKESEGGDSGCKYTIEGLPPAGAQNGPVAIGSALTFAYTCHNTTMAAFADGMRNMMVAQVFLGTRQVVDQTGLKDAWDFNFKYTLPVSAIAINGLLPGDNQSITLFAALDKQLGLKLDPANVATPVIVVDSANQKPTDNPPEVSTLPPPPSSEFDVADLKPSAPGSTGRGGGIQPGGRLDLRGGTLKSFMTLGYDIPSDEFLVGAPKWIDSDKYDLVAKAPSLAGPPSTQGQAGQGQAIDVDALRGMIRALLADRFKLVTHYEDRPVTAYTLTAVKPKLTKADPSTRTSCKDGPGPDGKDPRSGMSNPGLSRLMYCQNMTMAQFAEELPRLALGTIPQRVPVTDSTGLQGAWDFTLNFTPSIMEAALQGGRGDLGAPPPPPGGGPVAGGAAASDPSATTSLFDAITKQLGLKLEMQKRPMPVLVIDHVEQKPTEN